MIQGISLWVLEACVRTHTGLLWGPQDSLREGMGVPM